MTSRPWLGLASFLGLLLAAGGCNTPASGPSAPSQPAPSQPASGEWRLDELAPTEQPYQEASVTLKGTPLEASIRQELKGDRLQVEVLLRGQVLETEVYQATPTGFAFKSASYESFEPPIPLLKAENVAPSKADWTGSMTLAGQKFPATATISLTPDTLNIPGGPYETVKVAVNLTIETGGPKSAERTLAFWFSPGKGIIRRDIDDSSSRGPYVPAPTEDEEAQE